jgi:hypothetical protein
MTEWKASIVRHIPEDELHAYLDQALSRSQCVEIERHLARCFRCQSERDSIAALRDRTTALLARIGPPPILPPPLEEIRAQAARRVQARSRWIVRGAWAASLLGALVLGWEVNHRTHLAPPAQTAAATGAGGAAAAPAPSAAPTSPAPADRPAAANLAAVPRSVSRESGRAATPPRAAPRQLVRASRPAADAPEARFARAIETDPTILLGSSTPVSTPASNAVSVGTDAGDVPDLIAQPVGSDPGLQGLWRTIVPTSDGADRGGDIPLVPGLPVVQMRVQPGSGSSDVTAVDQLLDSGDLIRTISGPVERVVGLVDEDERASDSSAASHPDEHPDRMTVTIRQGDRMVAVTGPSQALGSLLARVNVKNAKRRY